MEKYIELNYQTLSLFLVQGNSIHSGNIISTVSLIIKTTSFLTYVSEYY